ncbi:hypothetical protein [Streptomyces sp. NPDC049915]|uniref:hypothetical protein n=1 Tax=Streptomyces sp. NPDC049915 TaxID=3155510 RepID=UPI0034295A9D
MAAGAVRVLAAPRSSFYAGTSRTSPPSTGLQSSPIVTRCCTAMLAGGAGNDPVSRTAPQSFEAAGEASRAAPAALAVVAVQAVRTGPQWRVRPRA